MKPVMTIEQLHDLMMREFPQMAKNFDVTEVRDDGATVRMFIDNSHLRPGGTVSGPTMFALADVALYLAILSRIGEVPLAVTTNASIDFMRKPEAGRDLLAECRILKLGRVLAVGDVLIRSDGGAAPVARCSMTYSIPPKRS